MQQGGQKFWNVPNALTLLRLLLIPVYWVLMMSGHDEVWALVVFVAASLTDLLDGYIARTYNQVTDWGKLFDPLADKLMVISVMLSLVIKGAVPVVILVILLLKEVLMIIGGALMLHYKVVVYAKPIGKVAQFVVVVGLILCFFRARFSATIHLYVLWVGIGLTLIALVFYAFNCLAAIRRQRTPNYPNQEV